MCAAIFMFPVSSLPAREVSKADDEELHKNCDHPCTFEVSAAWRIIFLCLRSPSRRALTPALGQPTMNIDELSDVVHTHGANETLINLSKNKYAAGMRLPWSFTLAAVEATVHTCTQEEPRRLLLQPIFRHYFRARLRRGAGLKRLDLLEQIMRWLRLTPVELVHLRGEIIDTLDGHGTAHGGARSKPASDEREYAPETGLVEGGVSIEIAPASEFISGDDNALSDDGSETSSSPLSRKRSWDMALWQSCVARLRAMATGPAAASEMRAVLDEAEGLLAGALHGACTSFVRSAAFSTGPCARFLSLVSQPVRDDAFHHVRPIGKGGYGQVWCSVKRDSGAVIALKFMSRKRLVGQDAEGHALDEAKALRLAKSDFVVGLHYAYATPSRVCLGLEWLTGGSLAYHLKERRNAVRRRERDSPFSEGEVRFYAASVVLALEALHAMHVVYRDLKPDNLLLDRHGRMKLTDFGLALVLGKGGTAHSKAGTRGYWAPEVIRRDEYRFEPDWWCLGVTLHALLALHSPFSLDANLARGSVLSRRSIEAAAMMGGSCSGAPGSLDMQFDGAVDDEPVDTLGTASDHLSHLTSMSVAATALGGDNEGGGSNDTSSPSRRHKRESLVKHEKKGKKTFKEMQKNAKQDVLILTKNPRPPDELGDDGAAFHNELLEKERHLRLGANGADEVIGHVWFATLDWPALRAGTLKPPLVPSAEEIHAGSIAQSGGVEDAVLDGDNKDVQLTDAHRERFAEWEWRDEERMQYEMLDAIAREGEKGAQLSLCERLCCACFYSC